MTPEEGRSVRRITLRFGPLRLVIGYRRRTGVCCPELAAAVKDLRDAFLFSWPCPQILRILHRLCHRLTCLIEQMNEMLP